MSHPPGHLRRKTLQGLFWQFLGVGGQQFVQLGSYMVIGRAIDPQDVGLFVILLTGIGLVESLTLFMGEQATIASPRGNDRRYLDTVFTVRVLRSAAISLVVCGLAPLMSWYYWKPEYEHHWLTGLFLAMSLTGFLDGFQSPGRGARLKNLDFQRVAFCDFLAAALGAGLTIALAVLEKSVWALMIGHISTAALRTTMSYVAGPHRPRFLLDRDSLRELLNYSKGAAGAPFLIFLTYAASATIIPKLLTETLLAVFEFAGRLAKIPENIFLKVLGPVAVPAYAQLRSDWSRLANAWLNAVRAFVSLAAPMTIVMVWCGGALPAFVYGRADYGSVSGLFALQCVYGGISALTAVVGPLFWAIGQPHRDRRAQFVRCIVIYAAGIPATLWFGILGFAVASCLSIVVTLLLVVVQAQRVLSISTARLFGAMRNGVVGAAAVGAALLVVDMTAAPTGAWRVAAGAAVGGPVFALLALRLLRERKSAAAAPTPAVETTQPSNVP